MVLNKILFIKQPYSGSVAVFARVCVCVCVCYTSHMLLNWQYIKSCKLKIKIFDDCFILLLVFFIHKIMTRIYSSKMYPCVFHERM